MSEKAPRKPTLRIPIDRERIAEICNQWGIREFALFGSVLRDDFRPESDVDVLVTLEKSGSSDTREGITRDLNAIFSGHRPDVKLLSQFKNPYEKCVIQETKYVLFPEVLPPRRHIDSIDGILEEMDLARLWSVREQALKLLCFVDTSATDAELSSKPAYIRNQLALMCDDLGRISSELRSLHARVPWTTIDRWGSLRGSNLPIDPSVARESLRIVRDELTPLCDELLSTECFGK